MRFITIFISLFALVYLMQTRIINKKLKELSIYHNHHYRHNSNSENTDKTFIPLCFNGSKLHFNPKLEDQNEILCFAFSELHCNSCIDSVVLLLQSKNFSDMDIK